MSQQNARRSTLDIENKLSNFLDPTRGSLENTMIYRKGLMRGSVSEVES